jgi:sulfate permease, SulP family
MAQQKDELSLTGFLKDFDRYSWSSLRSDLMSGLAVAMLTVPQAVAYAIVAGLPIACGFLAFIYSALAASLFCSSRHLIVGPSNAIAILIQAGLSQIFFTYYRDVTGPEREWIAVQIVTQLGLLIGVIQVLAAFFKLGRLTHFVSHSVIVGYISGVALALTIGQLFLLLGLPDAPATVSSLFEKSAYIFTHIHFIHWPTAIVGFTCLFIIWILQKIDSRLPSGVVMLAFMGIAFYLIDFFFTSGNFPLLEWPALASMIENIPMVGITNGDGVVPNWDLPFFNAGIMNSLLPMAFAIALLGVMEATSTSKSIAANSGQRLSTNQEIFGLGIGNMLSSFIGAMPVSGSPLRSVVNYQYGAQTRLSAVFNAFFIMVIVLVFGFLLVHLPLAAMAALLIASAKNMVNFKQFLLCMKATRSDNFVLIITLLSCLFFSLDIAFYIGVVMSITLYLKKAAIPQVHEFTVDDKGVLHSVEEGQPHESRKIRLIKIEGELFFGAADVFQSTLKSIAEDDTTTRVIILQLKNARDIDATGCLAIQQLYDYLRNSGRHLIACGLTIQTWDVLSDAGLVEMIGKSNLHIFDEKHPLLSMQKAFVRANELINTPIHQVDASLEAEVLVSDKLEEVVKL